MCVQSNNDDRHMQKTFKKNNDNNSSRGHQGDNDNNDVPQMAPGATRERMITMT